MRREHRSWECRWTIIDRAYAELDGLRSRLPDLSEALVPGTRRRWNQRDMTATQRARVDSLAREERAAKESALRRGLAVLGASAAPLDMNVLAAEMHIGEAVAVLEADLCQRFGLTPLRGASTADVLGRIIGLLDRVGEDRDLTLFVLDEARRLRLRAAGVLGEFEPMQRIDARCPICNAKSLRALPERELVVCANSGCRCDDDRCGCHLERSRLHEWAFDAWPGLAEAVA